MKIIEKIFSVRNEGNHKVIRICGIRLKFARIDKILLEKINYNTANQNKHYKEIENILQIHSKVIKEYKKIEVRNKLKKNSIGVISFLGGSFKEYLLNNNMSEKLSILKQNLDQNSIVIVEQVLKKILHLPDSRDYNRLYYVDIDRLRNTFDIPTDSYNRNKYYEELVRYKKEFLIPENYYNRNDFDIEAYYYHHGLKDAGNKIIEYINNKDFIDAGAYIGDSVLNLLKYNPHKIHSFELSTKTCEKYLETMKLNKVSEDKYCLINKGISDSCSVIDFEDSACQGTTLCVKGANKIETIDIDTYVEQKCLNVGFIKADVEGNIVPLIKGMKNTLQKNRPVLSLAIYHSPIEFFEAKPLLESLTKDLNYKIEIQSHCPLSEALLGVVLFAYPQELEIMEVNNYVNK